MANPTEADVKRATDAARILEQQGYLAKAKTGDERGASYLARLVASRVNPSGAAGDWGWLRKTGSGFHVDGFADGAIVFGNDPADRNNVLKIVTQVGSTNPNAIQVGSAVQERRESDVWASPVPVPDALGIYLVGSAVPTPGPVLTLPDYEALGGDAFGRAMIGVPLAADYLLAGQAMNDGSVVWAWRTCHSLMTALVKANGQPVDAAGIVKKHRNEWRAILGLPPV